jgi:hypothetical protein
MGFIVKIVQTHPCPSLEGNPVRWAEIRLRFGLKSIGFETSFFSAIYLKHAKSAGLPSREGQGCVIQYNAYKIPYSQTVQTHPSTPLKRGIAPGHAFFNNLRPSIKTPPQPF